ncbi:MAG: isocitrate lyase/PEP mutase family protein [Betaproteobacteria bacterium]|nr:isocitrate lyase/PEP mutase family protein [Betaproteobacteria bacterium]
MNMRKKVRKLLMEKDYIFTSGVANAMEAMILEKAGFDFIYVSGSGTSITQLGLVDVGLITETEMVNNARNIAKAVNIPVFADADNGYGNAINVIKTVEDFEAAGVAGIHIEDQESPKRCGHFAGKSIIPIEEAVGKIRAAVDAKRDKDFIIIARTDSVAAVGGGFAEAVRRGKAYARAGADVVFCEFSSPDIEEPRRFAEELHKEFPALPLFFNFSNNLKWYESPLTFDDIARLGYKIFIVSTGCIRVSKQAVTDYAVDLMNRKEQAVKDFQRTEKENLADFGGLEQIKALEQKYLPNEDVINKHKTVGI